MFLGIALALCVPVCAAEELSAKAAVSAREVFVGEPFQFQIQISGSDKPQGLDLAGIDGFEIENLGGQQNSSRSVTIVNGRMNQVVNRGYILNYRLTAQRDGDLVIPAVRVKTDRGNVQTPPVSIRAMKPAETDNFKLRLSLSKPMCYVGEPVMLTVTWYLGQDVRGFEFALPVLRDDHFAFENPAVDTTSGGERYRIPLGDDEVIAEKSRGVLDGHTYATVTFKKVLIPLRPDHVSIKPASVTCEALVGYRKSRDRFGDRFFDDFFSDSFFGRQKGVYSRAVVPSNGLSLDIRPVPEEGRPVNFAGHVGEYRIETAATPTDVSVGDPITLSIKLSGPSYLEHVALPSLNRQEDLAKAFKIPEERAEAKISGGAKIFTQTIRAMRPDVTEIPGVELPYFDTADGEYRTARSQPIPLNVKQARIVTADDAEGTEPVSTAARSLEAWTRGIAHNYENAGLLTDQRYGPAVWIRSPAWVGTLAVPPVAYALLFIAIGFTRRRNADPEAIRRRRAFLLAARRLRRAGEAEEEILDALRQYFGDKFSYPGAAVTFADVRGQLGASGVDEETISSLGRIFETCEAGRYAGNATSDVDPAALASDALKLLTKAERRLR